MAAEVEVTVSGIDEIAAKFKAVADRAKNLAPVFAEYGEKYKVVYQDEVYGGLMSPQGAPWAPREDSTTQRDPGGSLMNRTGALKGGLFARPSAKSLTLGIQGPAEEYVGFHQKGTKHMVSRPVMPRTPEGAALFESGPAKAWNDSLRGALLRYLLTGSTAGG